MLTMSPGPASLHALLHLAYIDECISGNGETAPPESLSFGDWCRERANANVHFDYWYKTLSIQRVLSRYVRSIRECNSQLYDESLAQVFPWLFALVHTHYRWWLSVYIRDMMAHKHRHPNILAELMAGNFEVRETTNKFYAMAID